jgi:hypothetical protein
MKSRLEQFVRDHRSEFDDAEPDNKLWDKIRQDMGPEKKKQTPAVRIFRTWWSVAAAVLLLVGGMTWYLAAGRHGAGPADVAGGAGPGSADTGTAMAATGNPASGGNTRSTDPGQPGSRDTAAKTGQTTDNPEHLSLAGIRPKENRNEMEADVDEEMYHYAKLVEIKHKELKAIEKDEPLLYRQFASDVSRLDSVYQDLQSQLPKNPNREQLLEAMLQNLQLQMGLLNHQLDIIKQINHSKKSAYEKAYKTT